MRTDRLLSIVMILSQRRRVTGKELAEHFETSLRTIYRDIEKLSEAGIPVAAEGGKGGGFYLMDGYRVESSFIKKQELEPLMAVMDNLGGLFGKNMEFNSLTSRFGALRQEKASEEKVEGAKSLLIDMSHFSMEEELKDYLGKIQEAIETSRVLELEYINRKSSYEERTVEPIQIEFLEGNWHLVGFCRKRKDYRRFKLVRIRRMELGEVFEKRSVSREELTNIFRKSHEENGIFIHLRFSEQMGQRLSEYFSKDSIRPQDDGTFEVTGRFPKDEGLKKFILGFGDACEVTEPESFREEMKEYVKGILGMYEG